MCFNDETMEESVLDVFLEIGDKCRVRLFTGHGETVMLPMYWIATWDFYRIAQRKNPFPRSVPYQADFAYSDVPRQ